MPTLPNYVPVGAVSIGDVIHGDDEHGDAFEVMEIEGGYRRLVEGWYWADDDNVGDLTEAARIAVTAAADSHVLAIARYAFERNLWKGALVESCRGSHREAVIDHVSWFPEGALVYVTATNGDSFAFDADSDLDPFGWKVRTEKGVPIMP